GSGAERRGSGIGGCGPNPAIPPRALTLKAQPPTLNAQRLCQSGVKRLREYRIHLPHPCAAPEGRREGDAVGDLLVVQHRSPAGGPPDEVDAPPAAEGVVDVFIGMLVTAQR